MALVKCQLCPVGMANQLFKVGEYIKHLRLLHASQPDFKVTCGINGCQRVYKNLGTFRNHLYAMHNDETVPNMTTAATASTIQDKEVTSSSDDITSQTPLEESMNMEQEEVTDQAMEIDTLPDNLQRSSALSLLRLKEKHKLTQVTVDSMVDNVKTLTHQNVNCLKSEVWVLIDTYLWHMWFDIIV